MPDKLVYEARCPNCGCEVHVWTETAAPIELTFAMPCANPTRVSEASRQGRPQDADGYQAVGSRGDIAADVVSPQKDLKAKFDRNAYQREYMRKRRQKERER